MSIYRRIPKCLLSIPALALSKVICKEYMNNEGVINVITLDPQIEQIVAQSIQRTEMGSFLALDPNMGQEILMSYRPGSWKTAGAGSSADYPLCAADPAGSQETDRSILPQPRGAVVE